MERVGDGEGGGVGERGEGGRMEGEREERKEEDRERGMEVAQR